jgi:hypothetical protein
MVRDNTVVHAVKNKFPVQIYTVLFVIFFGSFFTLQNKKKRGKDEAIQVQTITRAHAAYAMRGRQVAVPYDMMILTRSRNGGAMSNTDTNPTTVRSSCLQ